MSSSPENASAPPRENPLRLMNLPDGLLINFGAATLKEGLRRIVNNLPTWVSAPPREPIPAMSLNESVVEWFAEQRRIAPSSSRPFAPDQFSRGDAETRRDTKESDSVSPRSPRLRVSDPDLPFEEKRS